MKLDKAVILGLLVMSLFVGIIIISIGFGSEFTFLNTVMSPLVCPGEKIVPAWEYDGPELPFDVSVQGRWVCVDRSTGVGHAEGLKTTFIAGIVYGILILGTVILLSWWVNRRDQNPNVTN